jgi:hypothetical protein
MKKLSLTMDLGEGALRPEGAPFEFEFPGHTATFWIRALDGVAVAALAREGVDLEYLATGGGDEESASQRVIKTTDACQAILERFVAKWEGLKRADGSIIDFSEENLAALSGFPEIVVTVLGAAVQLAREQEGNSESSSAGTEIPS